MSETTLSRIGLIAPGPFGRGTARLLADRYELVDVPGDEPDLPDPAVRATLVLSDDARLPASTTGGRSFGGGGPWLPIRVELNTAIVGPVVLAGRPGCVTCLRTRARRARADHEEIRSAAAFQDRFATSRGRPTSYASAAVAEVLAGELDGVLAGGADAVRTRNAVIRVRLDDLTTSVHTFLPDPECPDCGGLPPDSAEAAIVTLQPRPKLDLDTYRVRDLHADEVQLGRRYVDPETGMIRPLQKSAFGIFPTTSAPMGLPGRTLEVESGFGRALDYRTAKVTAIAEAVERFGGMRPGGKRTVVRGSFAELADRALDPARLGLYPPERTRQPGFPYQPYHPQLELPWVWGYSFARQQPILVPESCVYYRLNHDHHEQGEADRHDDTCDGGAEDGHRHGRDADRPFVYEISNGCALGGCLEEAILHGILELVERDAFLLTWYAQLPVRRLDVSGAEDRRLPMMVERLRRETGADVHLFDTTMEHRIPSVWAMAVQPGDDDLVAKALCAAGSAFDPEKAIANALLELAPLAQWRFGSYPEEAARAAELAADGNRVQSMHDHSLLYCQHRVFDRLGFLFAAGTVPVAEAFEGHFRPRHPDLSDDLRATVDRFLDAGSDVVVVDQTTPEHRAGGFACVKVIIPGMLPMTFGHVVRRVDGLPRLHQVPHLLGYTDRPLRPDQVNVHPHPFP